MYMSLYTYSVATKDGKITKGERESESDKTLARDLKTEGLFPIEIKKKDRTGVWSFFRIDINELLARIRPISVADKMFFVRDLGVMISAGVPLTRSLEALSEETARPQFKKIIQDVEKIVVKGDTLAHALQAQGNVFSILFTHMVEAGEASGKLVLVLRLLARQMKKDYDLRKRVVSAMIYPAIIIMSLFVIGTLMMIFVVPTISKTIEDLGASLPITTQLIIAISNMLVNYGVLFLIALAAVCVFAWRTIKTRRGKELFDRIVLRIPLFGGLVRKYNTARMCRILAYLVASGIPIVRALEITSDVLGNTRYQVAVRNAAVEIQKGQNLHIVFRAYPDIFPPLVIQMVEVGEETGKISGMLLRLALFFEEEVQNMTKDLSTLIEPLLMIFIGVAVAFFALSILQPIYSSLGNM